MRPATARILTLSATAYWRQALRARGATLVVTNGCYDVLHPGHVASLETARGEGDALLVLLNSDASIRALKGPTRPIHAQADRAMVLASLRSVDAVAIFDSTDCASELAALAPEVYVKSEEYRDAQNAAERQALKEAGTTVVWLRRDARFNTTATIAATREGTPTP
jgi:rfaE bifunctional protein nucleotidyltransferase chain/domain